MKKTLDFVGAAVGLILFSPVLIVLTVLIAIKMGRPVLFKQVRPGINGKPFTMVKFRTMRDASDAQGNPLSDADRLTKLGLFLRSTSLDELPGLWNVLLGQMSLVGPRPLLMEYLPLYSPRQARRHEVRPGITGWAQIKGRNAISWDEKFNLDIWYVDNRTLWLDIKIIFLTIFKVIKRSDISAEDNATMPRFEGSRS